jgi:hypothetical protein
VYRHRESTAPSLDLTTISPIGEDFGGHFSGCSCKDRIRVSIVRERDEPDGECPGPTSHPGRTIDPERRTEDVTHAGRKERPDHDQVAGRIAFSVPAILRGSFDVTLACVHQNTARAAESIELSFPASSNEARILHARLHEGRRRSLKDK